MPQDFYSKLEKLLKKDSRFIDQEGDLLKSNVIDAAYKADKKLVELLFSQREFKSKFFSKIKDVLVFNINDFVNYIQDKNFLADSYTKYRNKIGLNIDGKFLNERKEVTLVWPFKDCILEGGMTKEDEKREEIFFNETLAQDEIDKLLAPKVLTNWKRYTQKGEEKVKELKRDKDGVTRENLIIKGNNLLALHSLKQQFQGEIKLIYIDPPYNIGGDFQYNDSFNHSTWLTFIKNRLEIARDLLAEDGAIFVQIDHHEVSYLNALMDEVFGPENKVQIISLKVSAASGFKAVNPGPIDVTEFIFFYTKNKNNFIFQKNYIATGYHENYNLYLEKVGKVENWKLIPLKEKVIKENGYKSEKEIKQKYGDVADIIIKKMISDFAFTHADKVVSIRDLHKPSEKTRRLKEESRRIRDKIIPLKKADGSYTYLINGGVIAFYSNKIKNLDGKPRVVELLTNFWNHISWAGIAREGGVKLRNGKKPEKLIKQIIEIAGIKQDDVILDFFLGSGTTCAVAHKLGIQYIGVEQLDYSDNDSIVRLKNVINGDQSGISKVVKWKSGGDFVYCELMKYNELFVEETQKAKNIKELLKIWEEMKEKSFLNYNVDIKKFDETIDEFKKLSFARQKHILFEILNKNQLYVNFSEINDSEFKVNKEDKELNKEFYG
ncbi:site-specific DNA-methyltransferase [Patescibacteria group bacterium]|nr:site-specific DNA-methyltransferase [Patescibacteria group bacterium]MBU4368036.1 site-specific DNA-methyltransferase [Patescibacteria group bacterium]MBU4462207.1 site-specific DNA-methyltransferase [Patescibacteria group bacterium]MCG2699563.1 site-specific DNA-methyltransferase [Candidatus Parcubacteria bacterium]